jgi:hypothetical protein
MGSSAYNQDSVKGSAMPSILPLGSIAQVWPEDVERTIDLLFSTARKTAMPRCCIWAERLFDHASLERLTINSAPFSTKLREIYPKVSSKQIGVENLMPLELNTVASVPLSQK